MKENWKEYVISRLKDYSDKIIITLHARDQAAFRGIDINQVIGDLKNPSKMVFARKQTATSEGEEKFDCYFAYSNTHATDMLLCFRKIY